MTCRPRHPNADVVPHVSERRLSTRALEPSFACENRVSQPGIPLSHPQCKNTVAWFHSTGAKKKTQHPPEAIALHAKAQLRRRCE
jgi:hypothetical protein